MDPSNLLMVLLAIVIVVSSWFALPLPWARLMIRVGRRLAGLHSKTMSIDGQQWHYLEGGSGPVLLLLHGFGGDADNWLKVCPRLVKHFRVVAPDLPGFGSSDRPQDHDFDIQAQLRRLHGFLNQLQTEPEYIGGNSMGGWLAAAYASQHAESLSGLWLLAPLGVRSARPSPMQRAMEKDLESPLQIADRQSFTSRVLEPMFGHLPWVPYPLRVHYGKQAVEYSITATSDFKSVMNSTDALEDLARHIQIPALLQWGSKDLAVDVSGAEVLSKSFPEVVVHVQQGVGHLPMLETPQASSDFFMEFYNRCMDVSSPSPGTSQPGDLS